MENIKIEKAQIKDAKIIYENIKKCADSMEKQGLIHWIPYYEQEKIEKDIEEKEVYIVKKGDSIIGNFTLDIKEAESIIYIEKLAIIPGFSGKGAGSKCLHFIEKHAKEHQIKYIKLDVYEKSNSAINFYKKNNYEVIGEKETRRFIVKVMQKEME